MIVPVVAFRRFSHPLVMGTPQWGKDVVNPTFFIMITPYYTINERIIGKPPEEQQLLIMDEVLKQVMSSAPEGSPIDPDQEDEDEDE